MSQNPLALGLMIVALGALLFAAFILRQPKRKEEQTFGTIFLVLGLLAVEFGFDLYVTQPIPAQYVEVYGVGYFVFAVLSIIGGATMIFGWDKTPVAYLGVLGGLILLTSARTIYHFAMSKSPLGTTALFSFAGLGSVVYVLYHQDKIPKWVIVVLFAACGLLALYSGLSAQFGHVGSALAQK